MNERIVKMLSSFVRIVVFKYFVEVQSFNFYIFLNYCWFVIYVV